MKLLNKQICHKNLTQTDIVVFDEKNSQYIIDYILDGIIPFTYNMRPEKIYIYSPVLFIFIKLLCKINLWNLLRNITKPRHLYAQLFHKYRLACFAVLSPKVVITFIDNSREYHMLCKDYKNAQFFAIQNGNRTKYEFEMVGNKYFLQHYFCFGEYEKDRFNKFGHFVKYFHPIGSLLYGIYKNNGVNYNKIKYDIGIVSCFRIKEVRKESLSDFWISIEMMHTLIAKYIEEYNLRAGLFMRYAFDNHEELKYLNNIYGDKVDYVGNIKGESTYNGIEMSEVAVSSLSTTLCETFGKGKKILYCDFTETDKYHDYDPMIMFTDPNYDALKKRLDELRHEPYKKYRKRTKQYASYLMNYNPSCPPHIYIRQKIEEYL